MATVLKPLSIKYRRGRRRQAHYNVRVRDTRLEIIRHMKIDGQKTLIYQLPRLTTIPVPHVNPFDGRANSMQEFQMRSHARTAAEHDQFRRLGRGEIARRKRGISRSLTSSKTLALYK